MNTSNNSTKFLFFNQTFSNPPSPPFLWYDYTLFVVILGMSISTGIYFGFFGNRQSSKEDYMMGNKKMKPLPVAISLIAAKTSSLHILVLPADVYRYGSAHILSCFSFLIGAIAIGYVYLPVYFRIQITSVYEYLEKRFDAKTRLYASSLFVIINIIFLPFTMYAPALAFSVATGVSAEMVALITCAICIFYTTIGGLRTVIWTDVIQFVLIVASLLSVLIIAVKSEGGFLNILNKAKEGERLNLFDFDPNPTKRASFWIILLGTTVNLISYTAVEQTFIQKLMIVATLREAVLCLIVYAVGLVIVNSISVFTGLAMYARYSDCDPVSAKLIEFSDQIVPYFVNDVTENIPGLFGLFIAGIFCAGLSTFSAFLNSIAVVVYEDFVIKIFDDKDRGSWPLKIVTLSVGIICGGLVMVLQYLGEILPLIIAISGLFGGPMLGVFTAGLLFQKTNSKGAFYGGIISALLMASIILPAKYLEMQGEFSHVPKPVSIENCTFSNESFKLTFQKPDKTANSDVNFIFRISFYYYPLIGAISSIIFGLIISCCTHTSEPLIDRKLLCSSTENCFMTKRRKKYLRSIRKPEEENTFL